MLQAILVYILYFGLKLAKQRRVDVKSTPPPFPLGLVQTTSAILARAHSRREQSFSSVDRLLSHSHHAIPIPVSHPEFWPFPFSLTPGRQRVNKVRSLPVVTRASAAFGSGGVSRTFPAVAALLEAALALAR